ncbi:hypothetical protein C4553_03655 [Candidatus Parcubacteria bacterium]|nr:MAG: hypothetical protein C4553_03655 [Candidatus Parcubacteria bacterium]
MFKKPIPATKKILPKTLSAWIAVLVLIMPFVSLAHEDGPRLDEIITDNSWKIILYASLIIAFFVIIALLNKSQNEGFKKTAFIFIALSASIATLYLAGSTVYLNSKSSSKGPVHWHADFRIFSCDEEINLIDPRGLSNRIGTPVLHEHNDNRIHVEGVVLEPHNVNLAEFFEVIGGKLNLVEIFLPTNDGMKILRNGDLCPNNEPANLNVFVYQIRDGLVTQKKIDNFSEYVLSPYARIPPGDCIIFEFDTKQKDKTDKICNFYKLELDKGDLKMDQ